MFGNKTNRIYQNRYKKATVLSLSDRMTGIYANKSIGAVLKQEMKNCNKTKTFPSAHIQAQCQLFKTTVNDSTITVQYGGSCAKQTADEKEKYQQVWGGRG
jgi:hypothetical protein